MKKILITGASRGIGRAICYEIANSEKASFALISRNFELLQKVKIDLEKLSSFVEIFICDVSNKEEFQNTIIKAYSLLSGLDIAILNAGISKNSWIFEDSYSATFEEIYRTNVFSLAYALETLSKLMKSKGGQIAIVSSLADVRGFPSSSAYSSSKSAVTKLAEAARIELKHYGIDVLTVKPGFVRTDMTAKNEFPMPFLMDAEKAARIIWNGIRENKKMISFPLPMVFFTKLISIIPNSVFDFLGSLYKPTKMF